MQICSDSHAEIVFEDNGYLRGRCPMCELIKEKEELEKELDVLRTERDDLTTELSDAKDYLSKHCPEYFL